MNKIKDYFTTPATWVTICVFVFGLGGMRATMNNRIAILEEKCHEVDTVKVQMYEIQTSLAQIQTDLSWIKANLPKLNYQNVGIQNNQDGIRANPI